MQRVFSSNVKSSSSVRISCCAMFRSFLPIPSNSATNNSPSHLSFFILEFLMNHCTHLITLKIWEYWKKCHRYHFTSRIVPRKQGITPFFFSFKISSSLNWTLVFGKSSSLCSNQDGPSHLLQLNKTFPDQLREVRLDRQRSPGIYLQSQAYISFARKLINAPQWSSPLIQLTAIG